MSFVVAVPEMVAAAVSDVAGVGAMIDAANAAAAGATVGIAAAGGDEVSAAIAALFSGHAQAYQRVGAEVAVFHARFEQALSVGARAYSGAEAANAALLQDPLQGLVTAVNGSVEQWTGRPLVGNGANGAPGSGADG
ncbi:PE family protein, partial [Mycobacterium basiliense]